jgi:exosortase/archaeosortase
LFSYFSFERKNGGWGLFGVVWGLEFNLFILSSHTFTNADKTGSSGPHDLK